jgi:hypothetical protein
MEGESQTVHGGQPKAVVRIQCFSFDLRGEAMGQSLPKDEAEVASSS